MVLHVRYFQIGHLAFWLIFTCSARLYEYSFTPILPSLCALSMVLISRSALIGLTGGALAGAILLAPAVWLAPAHLISDLLLPALQSRWNLCVLFFTLIMGGFVGLLAGGGAISALVRKLTSGAGQGSRRMEWITYGLGFGCFFDGLANSMLVGSTMRPIYDRACSSRTRLAYIVDSTSSPIACLALLSTWIAYQLSMIKEGLAASELEANPYSMFLAALPGNYYCWFTLMLVAIVIHRRWSPLAGSSIPEDAAPAIPEQSDGEMPGIRSIFVPLLFLVIILPASLWWSGSRALRGQADAQWVDTFAAADTSLMLVLSGLAASLVACTVYPRNAVLRPAHAFTAGVKRMLGPAMILIAAWALSCSLKELGAAGWIGNLLSGEIPLWLLPALVFLTGALISFLTGTSWGTMGIIIPLVIPLATSMATLPENIAVDASPYTFSVSVLAAAFSGAVFGDHCSPMSDTTIVSSMASGVEPMQHVVTQMPFAMIAAGLALFPGFIMAGWTGLLWPGLLAGTLALMALWVILGRTR